MQIDLDDNDNYATPGKRTSGTEYSVPGDSRAASGGWVSGGQFGEDGLAVRTPTDVAVGHYLNRVNPNFIFVGGFAIGAIYLLQGLVTTLGQANPNNHLMAANEVTAQANGTALTATTDALKTVANQRPSCIAIVCNFPGNVPGEASPGHFPRTPPDEGFSPDVLPAETFTQKEQQQQTQDYATQQQTQPYLAEGSFPRQGIAQPNLSGRSYPSDAAQPIAATARTSGTEASVPADSQLNVTDTPDYWRRQWQQNPDYVQRYIAYCQQQSIGWKSSDCQALYWTLQ